MNPLFENLNDVFESAGRIFRHWSARWWLFWCFPGRGWRRRWRRCGRCRG